MTVYVNQSKHPEGKNSLFHFSNFLTDFLSQFFFVENFHFCFFFFLKCCFCRTGWFKSTVSHQTYLTNVLVHSFMLAGPC